MTPPEDDNVRWLAMLLRRIAITIIKDVEQRYNMEPSLLTKEERERRARQQKAA